MWFGTLDYKTETFFLFLFHKQSCYWRHDFAFYVILQRPIVEFSLEDSRKLKIKEMRQQKNKVCLYQFVWQLHVRFPVQIAKVFLFSKWKVTLCWYFLQEFFRNRPFKGGEKPQSQMAGDGKGPRKGGNKAQSSSEQLGKDRGVKILFLYLCFFFIFVQFSKRIRQLDVRI